MGNGKLKRGEDLCMATCFENYGFLSPTQNGTNYNYKFIKKNLEQNGWKKIETTWLKLLLLFFIRTFSVSMFCNWPWYFVSIFSMLSFCIYKTLCLWDWA